MKVIRSADQGAELLSLVGRLTAGVGVTALRRIETSLAAHPGRTLILDLSRIEYADAAGVGALVRLHRAATAARRRLVLAGLPETVQEILALSGLAELLDLATDRVAAAAGRRGRRAAVLQPARCEIPVIVAS
ncbi:MAG: STAS domain-containing protein [Acidobacteriota bacterium]